jgi:hypothetical protein
MVKRTDAPRVQVAGTRDGLTYGTGGWYQGWKHLGIGYRWPVLGKDAPRLQVDGSKDGRT